MEEYREESEKESIVRKFFALRSKEEEIEIELEKEKSDLKGILKTSKIQGSILERVKALINSVEESDKKTKYLMSVALMDDFSFHDTIAFGVSNDNIYIQEEAIDSDEDFIKNVEMIGCDVEKLEEQVEDLQKLKLSDEVADNQEEILQWNMLCIPNLDDVIVEEKTENLVVERSSKSRDKFGTNKFKNDMKKHPLLLKLKLLFMAYEWDGITVEVAERLLESKREEVSYTLDKLYQLGYMYVYTTKEVGRLYCLSERGRKVFSTTESNKFINRELGEKIPLDREVDDFEDLNNVVIARICMLDSIRLATSFADTTTLNVFQEVISANFLVKSYKRLLNEENITFISFVSDDIYEYKALKEKLEKWEDSKIYIVIGLNEMHAKSVAEWIDTFIAGENEIYYVVYEKEDIIRVTDGMSIHAIHKNVVEYEKEEVIKVEPSLSLEQDKDEIEEYGLSECAATQEPLVEQDESIAITKEENKGMIIDENTVEEIKSTVAKMLCEEEYYIAMAYLRMASKIYQGLEMECQQLAYALNDPIEDCFYNSDQIFNIFFKDELDSSHYMLAAVIRNYFLDQCSYDYSIPQLHQALDNNRLLKQNVKLQNVIHCLLQFKKDFGCGIDKYADYRKKEGISAEERLGALRKDAEELYNNYVKGDVKENTSHKRFMETRKLLFSPKGDLGECLKIVMDNQREALDIVEQHLKETYIKEECDVRDNSIDPDKIHEVINQSWESVSKNLRVVKKTSDLSGSLRMNLFKLVKKVVRVLANYVAFSKQFIVDENDRGVDGYKQNREVLLSELKSIEHSWDSLEKPTIREQAGRNVLKATIEEMIERLEGTYDERFSKYFYVEFLKGDIVLLDDDYLPNLEDVTELPQLSCLNRIQNHWKMEKLDWEKRLKNIFKGQDDYGSASLIIDYVKEMLPEEYKDFPSYDLEKAIKYSLEYLEGKKKGFSEDMELAQSYGKIDNTRGNQKESIMQVMESWYEWARNTKNLGFFYKILEEFNKKITEDARHRDDELQKNLSFYLEQNENYNQNPLIDKVVEQICDRIQKQNYAAAEDLLNRLVANDVDLEIDVETEDYFEKFINEYDSNYRVTANSGRTLNQLIRTDMGNKDRRGGSRLVESWPRGKDVGEYTIKKLLNTLGFQTECVQSKPKIAEKIENYFVTLKKPQNGRKSNYKHPIAAFGSQAEEKEIRIVCLFGKTDAKRLVDTCKEIGPAKNTLIILDYALSMADRRELARKMKADLNNKIFAVIDRVVISYLVKHYTETAVNRMLMSIIMPFTYYQPYIEKSVDVMPPEIFMGRKNELEKIESPTGVNIVYGGRQLGKSALLRMAYKDIDMNENGDRAIIVDIKGMDYKRAAKRISAALFDEKILKKENITESWDELARDIKNRLRDEVDRIPYLLLMLDEADTFIDSCEMVSYRPFDALKDIQSVGSGRFKFVIAGLHNIVRFKKNTALGNNSVLTHLDSLTVMPFKATEARELLEIPLHYLGFRFEKDNETEVLISTILGTTNYFPGLLQLYCAKLIEAMKKDYAGYSEIETPPYIVREDHIKKVLSDRSLQDEIREKFLITLKVDEDNYYYILALLIARLYHENKNANGCSVDEIIRLAGDLYIVKIILLDYEKVAALLEEMRELNVLQLVDERRYRFARHSFCQMMGTVRQIDDELMKYME